jgi:menaquinone-specific isochorismate synthase
VIEALRDALAPLCGELDVPDKPSVLELRNVSHLATHITGVLTGTAPPPPDRSRGSRSRRVRSTHGRSTHPRLSVPSALELVARVHPTPAVGGIPAADATAYIRKVEGFDRGRYAGPVGWMDASGDGTWAIGIRSADVDGRSASMYAGVGLVAGSEPGAELIETQLKLQALLAALVRP